MKKWNKFNLKIIFFVKNRLFFLSIIISLFSIILILSKLFNLNVIMGISVIPNLNIIFNTLVLLSAIYCILFIPCFPIFFILFRKKDFNTLEKISLTIIVNLSYYILLGYIGFFLTNEISGYFIYFCTISTFFTIILYILLAGIKTQKYSLFKSYKSSFSEELIKNDFSLLNQIKCKIPLTGFLLIIFLLLNSILNIVRFDYFYGTDAWLHISITKMIVEMNYLPIEEFYGSLGFHIFISTLHFFSGVDIILIPKYFTFYTILVSALVFYNLLMIIFKNKHLAIFGVFLLEFSYLGFNYMMYQFWPASLALIQGLFIFYLLYKRFLQFVKRNIPSNKIILQDIFFYYSIITILFISATLTHSLTISILLISLMGVYLIYFIKNVKRGIDFVLLFILLIIFIILSQAGLGSSHFWFLNELKSYWKEIILLSLVLALPLGLLIKRIQKSILFTSGRYKVSITGKNLSFYKKFEDKFFIPFTFIIVIVLTVIFFIGNVLIFKVSPTTLLVVIELFYLIIFGIWGFALFQKKPKGKIFMIWFLNFALMLIVVFLFELFFPSQFYMMRIFYISSILFTIGCVAYFHKLIQINKIDRRRIKLFFIIFISFSLISSYIHEFAIVDEVSLKKQEVSTFKWFSNNNDKKSVIITEFGFNNIFIYYDYPYDNNNFSLSSEEIHVFIKHYLNLFPPGNHINETGHNILQELKKQYNSDVYITLDDFYYMNTGFEVYNHLTQGEVGRYYNLSYVNKIFTVKKEYGQEDPLYWVI